MWALLGHEGDPFWERRLSHFEGARLPLMSPNGILHIEHCCGMRWTRCPVTHEPHAERFVRVSVHWSQASVWRWHVILSHEVNSAGHFSKLNHSQMACEAAETFSLLHSERVKLTLGLIYSWGAGHEGKQKGYITTVYVAQIAPGFWMLSRISNEKSEQSEAPRGFWFIRLVNKLACLETWYEKCYITCYLSKLHYVCLFIYLFIFSKMSYFSHLKKIIFDT